MAQANAMLHFSEASLRAVETVLDTGARSLAHGFEPLAGRTNPLFPVSLTSHRLGGRGRRRTPSGRLSAVSMSRATFVRLVVTWSASVVALLVVALAVRWLA